MYQDDDQFTMLASTTYGVVAVRKDHDGMPITCLDEDDDFKDGGDILMTPEELFGVLRFASEKSNEAFKKDYLKMLPCPEKIQWILDQDYDFEDEFKAKWGMSMSEYVDLHSLEG